MPHLFRALHLSLALLLAALSPVAAQEGPRAWVQIEAQPTLAEAEARARAYAAVFPEVAGFRMASGWYAIVLGPYTPEGAAGRLAALLADNLVPADSFVALGEVYRAAYWPAGTDPRALPLRDAAAAPAPAPSPAPEALVEAAPAPPPTVPDETPAEARRSEAQLVREEREALQAALAFFGHYTSSIDGAIGPGTRAAMEAWQVAKGFPPTGILTTAQRATLLADRAAIEAELGLQRLDEPEAGISVDIPAALVEFDRYDPPFVQFRPRGDSGIALALISLPGDESALFGLYDVLQTLDSVPVEGARGRSESRFTIEGAAPDRGAYATATLTGGLIKGYLLTWPAAEADRAGRVLRALQASFQPVGRVALDPGLVPLDEATRAGMLAGMEVRRPLRSRSGFYVTLDGLVATVPEAVEGCGRVTLDRSVEADVTARDAAAGLVLLRPRAALAPAFVAGLEPALPRAGTEITVAGYSYEDALPAPALTWGTLDAATGLDGEPALRRLAISTLPGDAGGPVIDAAGRVLGMLLPAPKDGARQLPPGLGFALGAGPLAEAVRAAGFEPLPAVTGGALSPTDLAARATGMTALVSCWN